MCKIPYYQQPICHCIYISKKVTLCSLFRDFPANRNKTTFNPKLLTAHCEGMDLFFNGIDYVSDDIKSSDIAPTGLDCPEIDLYERQDCDGPCVLCDSDGVLKYLRVKGIEHKPIYGEEAEDKLPGEAVVERGAEDAGENAKGGSVQRSEGESEARPEGSGSTEKGGVRSKPSLAREVIERGQNRATGIRLAETMSA